jgi:hypothetical protein
MSGNAPIEQMFPVSARKLARRRAIVDGLDELRHERRRKGHLDLNIPR